MKLDDRTLALVAAIRAEANVAAVFGQYDRLQEIADRLKELEPALRKDEEAKVALFMAVEAVRKFRADLRASVEALRDEAKSDDDFDQGWAGACREMLDLLDGESFSEVSPGAGTTTWTETPWEAS